MINLFTLIFAPSFLVFIRYFDFKQTVLAYIFLSVLFFIVAYLKKRKAEDFIVISIYFILLIISYFSSDIKTIKFIPVFTSMVFVIFFIDGAINKKELILKLTQKFYPKQLSDAEVAYLKNGDYYWAISLFMYMLLLVSTILYGNNTSWAILSSVGWYIYFGVVLTIQILYGKLYAIKMYLK